MLPPLLDLCVEWVRISFFFYFNRCGNPWHEVFAVLLVVVMAKILTKVAASAADFVVI